MKLTAKILALTIALIMAMTLAACSDGGEQTPPIFDSGGDINDDDNDGDNSGDIVHKIDKGVTTLMCYSDKGFGGIALEFYQGWDENMSLQESDISDLTVYVNGVPHIVLDFYVDKWEEMDNAYHIWFYNDFTEYPAEYRVSLTIAGVDLEPDDFGTLIIDEEGNIDIIW